MAERKPDPEQARTSKDALIPFRHNAEEGLCARYTLRRASFKGGGLQADLQSASWEELRDRAYDGRGS